MFAHIYTRHMVKYIYCYATHCLNVLSTACVSGCDFDTIGDLCGWTSETENPDIFGFEQWNGPTDTEGTGPEDDFSKPGCKSFLISNSVRELL